MQFFSVARRFSTKQKQSVVCGPNKTIRLKTVAFTSLCVSGFMCNHTDNDLRRTTRICGRNALREKSSVITTQPSIDHSSMEGLARF